MKLFKDSKGVVYAYEEDGSQDHVIPADQVQITEAEANLLRNPTPTKQQLIQANVTAIQAELDAQAKAEGYDNIVSACSYAAQPPGAPFQAEGASFLAWRSDVWMKAYATLAQVDAGTAPMPTPAESVAAMPARARPA